MVVPRFRMSLLKEFLPAPLWLADAVCQRVIPAPWFIHLARYRGLYRFWRTPELWRPVRAELALAFPEKTERERTAMARRHMQFQAQHATVLRWCYRADARRMADVPILGIEYLDAALRNGRGAIIATTHFGYPRMKKHVFKAKGYIAHTVGKQKPVSPPVTLADRLRERLGVAGWRFKQDNDIGTGINIRPLVAALERNELLCLAIDGNEAAQKVTAEVLGVQVPFATGPVKIARKTGAAFLPVFGVSKPSGQPLILIRPPIEVTGPGTEDEVVVRVIEEFAAIASGVVREYPHMHRWKRVGAVRNAKPGADGKYRSERYFKKLKKREIAAAALKAQSPEAQDAADA